jgi:alginate O-acetyltransferase complex protein AlgI
MNFSSLHYVIFVTIAFIIFYLTPDRHRWLVLLVFSYLFYSTFKAPHLIFILVLVSVISYYCGIQIFNTTDERKRKQIFQLGSITCILILIIIKYLPSFLFSNRADSQYTSIFVSIGISYFILQAISHLSDIYLEIYEPVQHVGYHFLAMAFFPKLVQGPIERSGDLIPQLIKPFKFDFMTMQSGVLLFVRGLFKKVVIADRLAIYVNPIYQDVHSYVGFQLVCATYAFALQIYFDFAGYTDMARGVARIFGINLTANFNSPYLATSIADFWRRWHISFSRWILDYIFKPLQMSWRDFGKTGTVMALIATFLFSGLWHGATLGYLAWGGLHGIFLSISLFWKPYQIKLYKALKLENTIFINIWQTIITFHLVCFTYIFFRSSSLTDALYIVKYSVLGVIADIIRLLEGRYTFPATLSVIGDQARFYLYFCLLALVTMIYFIYRSKWPDYYSSMSLISWPIKVSFYAVVLYLILFMGVNTQSFIYMQF